MSIKKILSIVDHTLLSPTATHDEIISLCNDGVKYGVASVCVAPCYVGIAKEATNNRIGVCTVIGFPNGYNTSASKMFEVTDAIKNGADELDVVINLGWLKDRLYDKLKAELTEIKKLCENKILKVIIETCVLTREEKIKMCDIVTASGADYIKTSTGFSKSGATFNDVSLFKKYIGDNVKIKAAGGINSLKDAEDFMDLGASRLGTSKIVKIAKQNDNSR